MRLTKCEFYTLFKINVGANKGDRAVLVPGWKFDYGGFVLGVYNRKSVIPKEDHNLFTVVELRTGLRICDDTARKKAGNT
jgi:hypothetical protein